MFVPINSLSLSHVCHTLDTPLAIRPEERPTQTGT